MQWPQQGSRCPVFQHRTPLNFRKRAKKKFVCNSLDIPVTDITILETVVTILMFKKITI